MCRLFIYRVHIQISHYMAIFLRRSILQSVFQKLLPSASLPSAMQEASPYIVKGSGVMHIYWLKFSQVRLCLRLPWDSAVNAHPHKMGKTLQLKWITWGYIFCSQPCWITEMDLKGILICGSLPIASNCKHYNWAHRWLVVRPSKKLKKTIEHGKAVVRLGC